MTGRKGSPFKLEKKDTIVLYIYKGIDMVSDDVRIVEGTQSRL